ncbi:MAG: hypothetical protein UR82_C0086G0007, partial [Candidatus Moranbacteria bacterium GW2011_GWF1_35_5]
TISLSSPIVAAEKTFEDILIFKYYTPLNINLIKQLIVTFVLNLELPQIYKSVTNLQISQEISSFHICKFVVDLPVSLWLAKTGGFVGEKLEL